MVKLKCYQSPLTLGTRNFFFCFCKLYQFYSSLFDRKKTSKAQKIEKPKMMRKKNVFICITLDSEKYIVKQKASRVNLGIFFSYRMAFSFHTDRNGCCVMPFCI